MNVSFAFSFLKPSVQKIKDQIYLFSCSLCNIVFSTFNRQQLLLILFKQKKKKKNINTVKKKKNLLGLELVKLE